MTFGSDPALRLDYYAYSRNVTLGAQRLLTADGLTFAIALAIFGALHIFSRPKIGAHLRHLRLQTISV